MFTIQPELLYVQKNAKIVDDSGREDAQKFDLHLIQLPVSLQFGINLMVVRPYFQVVPYINYALAGNFTGGYKWSDVNRFNGGIGVGGGVDLWKFQLNIRYNWDFKKIGGKDVSDPLYERYKLSKGRALEISLGLFF